MTKERLYPGKREKGKEDIASRWLSSYAKEPPLCFSLSFNEVGKVALELEGVIVQEGEARTH